MESSMNESVEVARRFYAEELRFLARISSPALFAAFAAVPRERFTGPGPWRIMSGRGFWTTDDADPRHVYHNVLIALDEAKGINNGQPSLWAQFFDQLGLKAGDSVLHLGSGTGYYTAILVEVVGPRGRVTAVEIDAVLAERARAALEPWPQVTVIHSDGAIGSFEPADAVLASAGATHPPQAWLQAVKPGGRLLFPLTSAGGGGSMALLTRKTQENFAAHLDFGVYFIGFSGARDSEVSVRLAAALKRDQGSGVKSLRCEAHNGDETCWLHGDGWCFSARDPVSAESIA
jgi:protein-L-isoaspartate(D-aspartate) O-methyltransferase